MSNGIYVIESDKAMLFHNITLENGCKDVTLASDDGQIVEVHKLVLCAGSKFLNELLSLQESSCSWIHLSGFQHNELEELVAFLYTGELQLSKENMTKFLKLAELLAIDSVFQDEQETTEDTHKSESVTSEPESANSSDDAIESVKIEKESVKLVKDEETAKTESLTNPDGINSLEPKLIIDVNTSTAENMITRKDGLWECVECERTFVRKDHAKTHVQIHTNIQRVKCQICDRSFGTKDSLRNHSRRVHSTEKYNCTNCGKNDMSRVQYEGHKYQSRSCGLKYRKKN